MADFLFIIYHENAVRRIDFTVTRRLGRIFKRKPGFIFHHGSKISGNGLAGYQVFTPSLVLTGKC